VSNASQDADKVFVSSFATSIAVPTVCQRMKLQCFDGVEEISLEKAQQTLLLRGCGGKESVAMSLCDEIDKESNRGETVTDLKHRAIRVKRESP
jgi:hypothetical protein